MNYGYPLILPLNFYPTCFCWSLAVQSLMRSKVVVVYLVARDDWRICLLQIIEHTYAIVLWVFNFLERNKLPWKHDETAPNLGYHISRLQALVHQINHPLTRNPILETVSRKLTERKCPEDETEPAILKNCRLVIASEAYRSRDRTAGIMAASSSMAFSFSVPVSR